MTTPMEGSSKKLDRFEDGLSPGIIPQNQLPCLWNCDIVIE